MAHQETPKPPDPGECPFDDPAVTIPSQFSAILVRRPAVVASCRNDGLDAAGLQRVSQSIAVVAPVGDQAVWIASGSAASMGTRHGNIGVPAPSTRSIHFVPLPRFVLPTLAPPSWRGQSCHPRNIHPNATSRDHSNPRGRRATSPAAFLPLPKCAGA